MLQRSSIHILCFFLSCAPFIQAQDCCLNHIPNPSFELTSEPPSGIENWTIVESWINAASNNSSYGSPDYFYQDPDDPSATLPNNSFSANVVPVDGDAVMGMAVYFANASLPAPREYIAVQFCPLTVGKMYEFKFYLTQGTPQNQGYSVDRLGVFFSEGPTYQSDLFYDVEPQILIDTVFSNNEWQEITYTFTAQEALDFLVFGSFGANSEITANSLNNSSPFEYAYYFVDNFSIREIGPDVEIELPIDSVAGICNGETYTIDTAYPDATYEWSTGDSTQSITVSEEGLYSVTVTDECLYGEAEILITSGIDTVITIPATICEGDSFEFEGETYDTEGEYTLTYTAITGCDSLVVIDLEVLPNPINLVFANICESENYEFFGNTYDSSGIYSFALESAAANGCDSIVELNLEVFPNQELSVDTFICEGLAVELNGELFDSPGQYTQLIEGVSPFGCDLEVNINLQAAEANLELRDTTILKGDQALLLPFFSGIGDIAQVQWSPNLNLSCNDCFAPLAAPSESTTYTVEITDATGCTYVNDIQVDVLERLPIFIPNAFSPNDDGFNDLFFPTGSNLLIEQINQFQIFNRWGSLVFERSNFLLDDESAAWDGRYNNELLSNGVYVYTMEVLLTNGSTQQFRGDVLLIH